jgi:Uma2 family endonuclease
MTVAAEIMTAEEYLEFEKHSELKHEFVDGRLVQMPGPTRKHGKIVNNIVKALDDVAIARGCELQSVELKLRTRETRFRYPDVMISCNPGSDLYFLSNPCFVVEVTSDSTSEVDYGKKLEEYLRLPSVEQYAIVSQLDRFVIVYRRDNDVPTFSTFEGPDAFEVTCLGVSLSLDQIYANLEI